MVLSFLVGEINMAVAGSSENIPSFRVNINHRSLQTHGPQVNRNRILVKTDMSVAAEALRNNPGRMITIDAKRFSDLRHYLIKTGHIDE